MKVLSSLFDNLGDAVKAKFDRYKAIINGLVTEYKRSVVMNENMDIFESYVSLNNVEKKPVLIFDNARPLVPLEGIIASARVSKSEEVIRGKKKDIESYPIEFDDLADFLMSVGLKDSDLNLNQLEGIFNTLHEVLTKYGASDLSFSFDDDKLRIHYELDLVPEKVSFEYDINVSREGIHTESSIKDLGKNAGDIFNGKLIVNSDGLDLEDRLVFVALDLYSLASNRLSDSLKESYFEKLKSYGFGVEKVEIVPMSNLEMIDSIRGISLLKIISGGVVGNIKGKEVKYELRHVLPVPNPDYYGVNSESLGGNLYLYYDIPNGKVKLIRVPLESYSDPENAAFVKVEIGESIEKMRKYEVALKKEKELRESIKKGNYPNSSNPNLKGIDDLVLQYDEKLGAFFDEVNVKKIESGKNSVVYSEGLAYYIMVEHDKSIGGKEDRGSHAKKIPVFYDFTLGNGNDSLRLYFKYNLRKLSGESIPLELFKSKFVPKGFDVFSEKIRDIRFYSGNEPEIYNVGKPFYKETKEQLIGISTNNPEEFFEESTPALAKMYFVQLFNAIKKYVEIKGSI